MWSPSIDTAADIPIVRRMLFPNLDRLTAARVGVAAGIGPHFYTGAYKMNRLNRLICADRRLRHLIDSNVRLANRGVIEHSYAIAQVERLVACLHGVASKIAELATAR